MKNQGIFITFEGGEGCGKSTVMENVYQMIVPYVGPSNLVSLREPGSDPVSEQIRNILLNPENKDSLQSLTELFLFEAARSQFVSNILKPNLEQNKIVLCDRYFDSTTAYQGYGRGISLEYINYLNRLASQEIIPDLTLLLDSPVEVGLERALGNGKKLDRIEQEGFDFLEKVRQGFLEIAKNYSDRFIIIDAARKKELVVEEAYIEVYSLLYTKGIIC